MMAVKVDTKGACFMCLKKLGDNKDDDKKSEKGDPLEEEGKGTHHHHHFKMLTRYLKVDLGVVVGGGGGATSSTSTGASSSVGSSTTGGGGGEGVSVPLCAGCGALARSFAEVYQRLELFRLKADGIVREIHGVMVAAGGGSSEEEDHHRDLVFLQEEPQSLSDKLRKEVVQKCSSVGVGSKTTSPKFDLDELVGGGGGVKAWNAVPRGGRLQQHCETDDIPPVVPVVLPPPPPPVLQGSLTRREVVAPQTIGSSGTTSSSSSSDGISFKKLPDGRHQCSACSKIIKEKCIWSHKRLHLGNSRSYRCGICSESFKRQSALQDHSYWKHRSTFFAAQKEPSLTSEQFEGVIVALFAGIPVPRLPPDLYQCVFCGCDTMKRPGSVHNHFIVHHMDQLVPRLMELQKDVVMRDEPAESSSAAIENASSSSSSLLNYVNHQEDQEVKVEEEEPEEDLKPGRNDFLNPQLPDPDTESIESEFIKLASKKFCEGNKKEEEEEKVERQNEVVPRSFIGESSSMETSVVVPHPVPAPPLDDDEQIISFNCLPDGRYQCRLCNQIVRQTGRPAHQLAHAGGQPFKCNHCPQAFHQLAALREHKLSKHRSLLFAKHKEPSLSPEQFEGVLDTLFATLMMSHANNKGRKNNSEVVSYSCDFCDSQFPRMKSRGRVENHWIRRHMKELVPRLMELQTNMMTANANNVNNFVKVESLADPERFYVNEAEAGGAHEGEEEESKYFIADGGDDDDDDEEEDEDMILGM